MSLIIFRTIIFRFFIFSLLLTLCISLQPQAASAAPPINSTVTATGTTINLDDNQIITVNSNANAIQTQAGGIVNGKGTQATSAATSTVPVLLSNGSGSLIYLYDGAQITSTAATQLMVQASNFGTINLSGATLIGFNNMPANLQRGLYATSNGVINLTGASTITVRRVGAWMDFGGLVKLGPGTVINIIGNTNTAYNPNGAGSAGIEISGVAVPNGTLSPGITVNIDNGLATPNPSLSAWLGASIHGPGASAIFDNLLVQGKDANAGFLAAASATANVVNSSFVINGIGNPGTNGIYLWPVNVQLSGLKAFGMQVYTGATLNVSNTDVLINTNATLGGGVSGIRTGQASTLNLDNVRIVVNGIGMTGSFTSGLVIIQNSTGNIANTNVTMNGANSEGARVGSGSTMNANALNVVTNGANSIALHFGVSGSVNNTIVGSKFLALGPNNTGLLSEVDNAQLTMSGSSITSTGTAIRAIKTGVNTSSNTVLNFKDGTVVNGGNGVLLEVLASGLPNPNTVILNASSGSQLFGDINPALTGTSTTVNLNTSAQWTGASHGLNTLNMNGGSLWNMTGDSILGTLNLDDSTIAFAPPSSGVFKTLTTTGNYNGQNGLIRMNTSLGDSSSPTDLFLVQGDTAGKTFLAIANADGEGALTSGFGIKVVDVLGSSDGSFSLLGRAAAGIYEYALNNPGDGNWYLSSTMQDNPGMPNIRPEVPLNSTISPLALTFGYTMLDTLHERVGETWRSDDDGDLAIAQPFPDDTNGKNIPPSWGRIIGGQFSKDSGNNLMRDGPRYSASIGGAQFGQDLINARTDAGSLNRAGVYVGAGHIHAGVRGTYSGSAGEVDINAYSAGLYWTHLNKRGWYTDAVLQGTTYTAETESHRDEKLRTHGLGLASSLEGGYALPLGMGVRLEPQAQLTYQVVNFDNASDSYGRFEFGTQQSLRGRASLRLAKDWPIDSSSDSSRVLTWVRGSVVQEFLGRTETGVCALDGEGMVYVPSYMNGTTGKVDLGVSVQLNDKVSLFATGGYGKSLDGGGQSSWDGRLGVTIEW